MIFCLLNKVESSLHYVNISLRVHINTVIIQRLIADCSEHRRSFNFSYWPILYCQHKHIVSICFSLKVSLLVFDFFLFFFFFPFFTVRPPLSFTNIPCFYSEWHIFTRAYSYLKGKSSPWQFLPVMFDSRGRFSSPFPSHRASVLSEDNLPWSHGQCDLDTERCYLPTEVVPIYLLAFACFQTASLAGDVKERKVNQHYTRKFWKWGSKNMLR